MPRMPHKGVYAALPTSLNEDYSPNPELMIAHARWLLDQGCAGVAPLGTTGEATSLSVEDRKDVVSALAEADLPMDRMVVGVGTASLGDTVGLASAAFTAGAGSILVLPPFYYKSPSEEGLFRFYAALADRLGSHDPKILLYHFPGMSAVPITLELTARLREAYPGVFVGLKDSSLVLENTLAFIEAFEGFHVYSGSEGLLPQVMEAGGAGCISATTNLSAPLAVAAFEAKTTSDRIAFSARADTVRSFVSKMGVISGAKGLLAAYSGKESWARTAPPNLPLSPENWHAAHKDLEAIEPLEKYFQQA